MNDQIINSLQNPAVKHVVKLQQKAQERRKHNQFAVEGVREVSLALQAGYLTESIFVCPEIFISDKDYPIDLHANDKAVRKVTAAVYNKMAYRKDAEGIIMLSSIYDIGPESIRLSDNPLVIVLEGVEKPGNLGAILRTADAAAADAVIICDPQTDIFNPNVIRSSLGCFFNNQVAVCTTEQFASWAQNHNLSIMIASVQAQKPYHQISMKKPVALVFGTEAHGLSEKWYALAEEKLKIPMLGKIDSLNVSASVAIMVFEALRQRNT